MQACLTVDFHLSSSVFSRFFSFRPASSVTLSHCCRISNAVGSCSSLQSCPPPLPPRCSFDFSFSHSFARHRQESESTCQRETAKLKRWREKKKHPFRFICSHPLVALDLHIFSSTFKTVRSQPILFVFPAHTWINWKQNRERIDFVIFSGQSRSFSNRNLFLQRKALIRARFKKSHSPGLDLHKSKGLRRWVSVIICSLYFRVSSPWHRSRIVNDRSFCHLVLLSSVSVSLARPARRCSDRLQLINETARYRDPFFLASHKRDKDKKKQDFPDHFPREYLT